MTTVAVVYYSGSGHTAKMAEAVLKGVSSVTGVRAELISIRADDIIGGRWKNDPVLAQLDAADAIIFGAPTYMGGPAAQFKAFADGTSERWFQRKWVNKVAGGFTVSGGPSGDKLSTLSYLLTFSMQHGMVWAGLTDTPFNEKGINRLGSYSGAMGQAFTEAPEIAPNDADKLTGEVLGRRVAEAAVRWVRGA
jgi:NAD(P)H dehydrogenase (quinone)